MPAPNYLNSLSMWRWALKRCSKVLQEEGLRSLWFKILDRTGVYRRLMLMEIPLDEPPLDVTTRLPVVIDLLNEAEVEEYVMFRPEANPSELHCRLGAGHWCFVARHEAHIVHACWATSGRAWIDWLAHEIPLTQHEVYVYDGFTLPRFRGLGISPARAVQMVRYFSDAGYQRMIASIGPQNRAAFRSAEKAGYRPFGITGYIGLGPWRQDFGRVDIHRKSRAGAACSIY